VGFGKALSMMFTQVVKCDYCGRVIADARNRPTGSSSADLHGGAGF
jgi:ribosomal protein S27E